MSYLRFQELRSKVTDGSATPGEQVEYIEMQKNLAIRADRPQDSSLFADLATAAIGMPALGGMFSDSSSSDSSSFSSDASSSDSWSGSGGDFSGGGSSGDW